MVQIDNIYMELVIGIIGILLTLWTIKMQFFSKPNEELKHLTIQFMATQKFEMFPNFTYRTCLEEMKSSFKTNLSDDVLKTFLHQNPSKPTILSTIKSLEVQHENLMQLQANLNLIRKQMANDE